MTRKSLKYLSIVNIALGVVIPAILCSKVFAASASVYFSEPNPIVVLGQEFIIRVLVDSDQPVNAYIVNLHYNPEAIEFTGFDNSRSLIDIAQSLPQISAAGDISFKGGSIAYFKGTAGELLAIRFRPLTSGSSSLQFAKVSLYLANGKGTKILPDVRDANLFARVPTVPATEESAPHSTAPPEIKFLAFVQDPFNSQQKLLSFSISDPGSGVRKIVYRSRNFIFWSVPSNAINPVALTNDVWSASLEVTDNAGNISQKTVYDWPALFRGWFLLLIIFSLAAISIGIYRAAKSRRKSYKL